MALPFGAIGYFVLIAQLVTIAVDWRHRRLSLVCPVVCPVDWLYGSLCTRAGRHDQLGRVRSLPAGKRNAGRTGPWLAASAWLSAGAGCYRRERGCCSPAKTTWP